MIKLKRDPVDGAWTHPTGMIAVFRLSSGPGWVATKPHGGVFRTYASEREAADHVEQECHYAPREESKP